MVKEFNFKLDFKKEKTNCTVDVKVRTFGDLSTKDWLQLVKLSEREKKYFFTTFHHYYSSLTSFVEKRMRKITLTRF